MSKFISVSGYNETWRKQRSYLKHALTATVIRNDYASLFEMKAQQYLARCLDRPENVLPETSRCFPGIAVRYEAHLLKLDCFG